MLPPAAALRVTADELPSGRGRAAVMHAADEVAAGADPVEALHAVRGDLPASLAGLMDLPAGHRLPAVLTAAASAAADRADERRGLGRALFWPLTIAAATALVGLAALALLAPPFRELYQDFGTPIPWGTEAALTLGEWLRAGWFLALPFAAALLIGPLILLGGWGTTRWPLVVALRPGEQARACELLAVLIDARVPLPEALRAVGWTSPDARLGVDLAAVATAVRRGVPAAAATFGRKWVPAPLRAALRWADDPDALAEGLRSAAAVLRARVRGRLGPAGLLTVVLQPILMLGVATAAAALAYVLIQPLIGLMDYLM